jgi:DNA-directed RNA polymerase
MTNPTVNQEEDLMSIQLKLEENMTERGALRFMRGVDFAVKSKSEDNTTYGQQILKGRITALATAIDSWMKETATGRAGNNVASYRFIKGVDTNLLSYLTLKGVMSGISVLRTLQDVAISIGTAVEDELRLADIRAEERKSYEKIIKGANKRGSTHYRHIYAVRAAKRVDTWKSWGSQDRFHVGMKLLDICMSSIGIVEVKTVAISKNKTPKYLVALQSTLDWIDEHKDVVSTLRPVFEPMVVQPKDWEGPTGGGYISSAVKPQNLVKIRNKMYLDELKHVDMPVVYEAVNTLQRTAWQINSQVYEVMSHLWDTGSTVGGLPSRDGVPLPEKPHDIDTNEEARRKYRSDAAKVHTDNLTLRGHRVSFHFTLDIAKRYNNFKKIFMPYQLDFRGRIYAMPHLNPQGADYQKALLRFAHGKPLGEEGWKWLAIHGANVAGNDKVSLEQRVNWVLDNEEEIISIATDPYNNRGWSTQVGGISVDKPWQFLAFCFEWYGYVQHGESFVSKIPVALDGSCSGIQHFSAMLRDQVGGAAVNLVPQDLPADVYQLVADKVIEQAKWDLENGTEDTLVHGDDGTAYVREGTKTLAKQWLEFGITRKVTKRSVMTLAYGSKMFGFKEQVLEDTLRPAFKSGQPFPFGNDGYMAAHYMASAIWTAVNKVLIKAGEAMRWLQDVASIAASENLPIRWTTPVGFPVMQLYPELKARRVRTAIHGKIIKMILNEEQESPDKRRMSQGIAPNFVHSADAAHLMLTVVRAKQEGLSSFAMIHDSFGTTAGETETLYRVVREAFVEMYEEVDVLEQFKEEIAERLPDEARETLPPIPGTGNLSLSAVCDSRYCFA